MVLLQKLSSELLAFGQISDYIIGKLTTGESRITFFVTNNCQKNSLKSIERKRLSSVGLVRVKPTNCEQNIPLQLIKFLEHPKNKINLVTLLIDDWSTKNKQTGGIRELSS